MPHRSLRRALLGQPVLSTWQSARRLSLVALVVGLVCVPVVRANAATPVVWGQEQTLLNQTFQGAAQPIAADDAGNVFAYERTPSRIVELPVGSSTATTLPFGTIGDPGGIAVDSHDDVFFADPTNGRVLELLHGASAPITLPFGGVAAEAIAVDAGGDVFISNDGLNEVFELAPGASAPTLVPFTNLSSPVGVAAFAGNVYVADSGHNQVLELPAGSSTQQQVAFGSLVSPSQLGVDSAGDLYVGDAVKVLELAAGTTTPTTIVARYPNTIAVNGNGDLFVSQGSGVAELPAGNRIPVMLPAQDVTSPADIVSDGRGDLFLGDGGRLLELPAGSTSPVTLVAAGQPLSIAVQPSGSSWSNLYYFSFAGSRQLYKLANGASSPVPVAGFGTTDLITRIAVDAAGDLYGIDQNTHEVLEVPGGSATATPLSIGGGSPGGLTLDSSGDLYVSNDQAKTVQELASGATTATTLPITGLEQPADVAVDGSGDVFVYDSVANDFAELDAHGTQTAVPFVSPAMPSGIAADQAGNVYMTDTLHGTLSELSKVSSSAPILLNTQYVRTQGQVGEAFNDTYQAAGYPAPAYAVTAGALPPGLTLDGKTGTLSGTPTTSGTFTFTIEAANVAGTADFAPNTFTVHQPVTMTADTPPATVALGHTFSYRFSATGYPAPTLQLAGQLPAGLSFNPATGLLSGTPTQNGVFFYTVTASNGTSQAESGSLQLTVSAAPVFTAEHPPSLAGIHTSVTYRFVATGLPNPTFAVASGALPPGLSLDAASGELSGHVTKAGGYTYAVEATNSHGTAVTPTLHFTVSTAPNFTVYLPPHAVVGHKYHWTMHASGYPHPTYRIAGGHLPAGLHLDKSGAISGTPTKAGRFGVTFEATNVVTTVDAAETLTVKRH